MATYDLGTIGYTVVSQGTDQATASISNLAQKLLLAERHYRYLDRAKNKGLISLEQYGRGVQQVDASVETLTASLTQQNAVLARNSTYVERSQRGANRFGMVAQQVGYQVGDFFVQVQSGTNALTAFGQQGTQLAGLLPGVAGAIVGIGISLGTALGMASLRGQNLAINFQKVGEDILSALEPVRSLIDAIGSGLSIAGQAASQGLETLIQNLDRIVAYGGTVAALFAGRYVAGLVAATAATASLSGALLVLRGALIRTGIGALIVAAGELVYQFTRLVSSAGGFGDAMSLLWGVVSEFGSKVVSLFQSLQSTFEAAANFLAFRFIQSINTVLGAFIEMTNTVADGMNSLFNTNVFQGAGGEATQELARLAIAYEDAGNAAASAADSFYKTASAPFESAEKLRLAMENQKPDGIDLSSWLTQTEEDPKGRQGALRKEKELTKELTAAEKDRQTILQSIEGSLESGFMAMVDGTKSVKDAFKSMAAEIIKELYRVLVVQRLVGGISGAVNMLTLPAGPSTGTLGLPKFATGGSMMPGGSYIVGENGPELVIPRHSGTVVNANQTANAMGGSGGFTQNLSINVSGSDATMVRTEIAKMIPQITNATKAAVIDAKQRGGQMAQAFR